ncbi:ead/Ea22-like family protein, partial [Salmonella enterica subsp. enterica serovar Mbandaka]|nr:ead/Ea22-like family protein [Salmonella enterica subsp. enterica serovar Mbandaka]EEJ0936870.1 ead/Ea22-like family protein [Salmonella enterica]EIA7604999.1 ead/Ea22-like family protein [Salmonella enterica subsp. enterica serovar Mbandaka]
MKEVKIYTIVSDQLSPPITGESFCTDMVRHSDYADLEEKCAALAAENAGLKKSEVEFNEYCRRECEDVGDTWVDDFTETPATDEFLAEVRAQAHKEGA